MTMSLASLITFKVNTKLESPTDLSTPTDELSLSEAIRLASGTGSGSADREFHDSRTLTTGATEDLDLAGGLTDPLGNTLTFATIKAIVVLAASGNTTNLTLGNGTNAWVGPWGATGTEVVKPGGLYVNVAPGTGWTVTASTADILKVANAAGASATYRIVLLGTSA